MLPKTPQMVAAREAICGSAADVFPDSPPVDRPGGPPISYVKPLVRMAGMAQDIPDFAVISWRWMQPVPINYDATTKTLHMGLNFVNVPSLVRSGTQHANRLPRIDEAKHYAWHVDTSGPNGVLYSSDGKGWHRIGINIPGIFDCCE